MDEKMLTEVFRHWGGHQLRVFYPGDEGLYIQGPISPASGIFATAREDFSIDLHFNLDWAARSVPGSERWELVLPHSQSENAIFTIEGVTPERAQHLATLGKCPFPGHEFVVCFIPPNDHEWIEQKPEE